MSILAQKYLHMSDNPIDEVSYLRKGASDCRGTNRNILSVLCCIDLGSRSLEDPLKLKGNDVNILQAEMGAKWNKKRI